MGGLAWIDWLDCVGLGLVGLTLGGTVLLLIGMCRVGKIQPRVGFRLNGDWILIGFRVECQMSAIGRVGRTSGPALASVLVYGAVKGERRIVARGCNGMPHFQWLFEVGCSTFGTRGWLANA